MGKHTVKRAVVADGHFAGFEPARLAECETGEGADEAARALSASSEGWFASMAPWEAPSGGEGLVCRSWYRGGERAPDPA